MNGNLRFPGFTTGYGITTTVTVIPANQERFYLEIQNRDQALPIFFAFGDSPTDDDYMVIRPLSDWHSHNAVPTNAINLKLADGAGGTANVVIFQ